MTPNGFPEGQAVFLFIPIVLIFAALWVLTIAVRDQAGRPKHNLPTLPDPGSHPLHHVRVQMAATKRKAKVAARKAQEAQQAQPLEPQEPGETGETGTIRQFRKRA
jgi:hypothetical protein